MTINILKILCLSSALALPVSAIAAENPRDEIGTNAAVKGLVTITGYDAKPLQAIVRKPVFMGDEVNARHESSLQVLLKDKTVFTVGPETQLTIDEYVYNDKKAANRLSASVKRGMFRFVSGKASQESPENITINTPTASMGIRGTIFEGLVGPEALLCAEKEGVLIPGIEIDYTGASLIVLRGPGQNSNTNNRKGQIEVTSGGETVTLTESGTATFISNKDFRPSPPFAISQPLFDYFNRRLRTEPRGDMNFEPFEADPRIIRPVITLEPNDDEGLTPYSPIDDLDVPGSSLGDDLGGGLNVIGGGTTGVITGGGT